MTHLPRITVVTPSYNQGPYLERTLTSVLDQGYPNLEFLVYDAESTDSSPEIIRRYAPRLDYHEIAKDRGQCDAINKGLKRATGDILCWLNSDDYFLPDALHTVGTFFDQHPDVVLLNGSIDIVDVNEKFLRAKKARQLNVEELLPWGGVPGQAAVFFRRQVFEEIGGLRLDLHYGLDWEYWLRILLKYGSEKTQPVSQVFAAAREWPEAKTETAAGKDAAEVRRILDELFANPALPENLRSLRDLAYARTWWKQSQSEVSAGLRLRAWHSLCNAARLSPAAFSASKYLRQITRILLAK